VQGATRHRLIGTTTYRLLLFNIERKTKKPAPNAVNTISMMATTNNQPLTADDPSDGGVRRERVSSSIINVSV
jgi:hypothetical protein